MSVAPDCFRCLVESMQCSIATVFRAKEGAKCHYPVDWSPGRSHEKPSSHRKSRSPKHTSVHQSHSHQDQQQGAVVVQWSDHPPPTKGNRVQFPAGLLSDFLMWESCQVMPLVVRFSLGCPVSPPLHSDNAPFPNHLTYVRVPADQESYGSHEPRRSSSRRPARSTSSSPPSKYSKQKRRPSVRNTTPSICTSTPSRHEDMTNCSGAACWPVGAQAIRSGEGGNAQCAHLFPRVRLPKVMALRVAIAAVVGWDTRQMGYVYMQIYGKLAFTDVSCLKGTVVFEGGRVSQVRLEILCLVTYCTVPYCHLCLTPPTHFLLLSTLLRPYLRERPTRRLNLVEIQHIDMNSSSNDGSGQPLPTSNLVTIIDSCARQSAPSEHSLSRTPSPFKKSNRDIDGSSKKESANLRGVVAVVGYWLDYLPPTKANQVQFLAGSPLDFRIGSDYEKEESFFPTRDELSRRDSKSGSLKTSSTVYNCSAVRCLMSCLPNMSVNTGHAACCESGLLLPLMRGEVVTHTGCTPDKKLFPDNSVGPVADSWHKLGKSPLIPLICGLIRDVEPCGPPILLLDVIFQPRPGCDPQANTAPSTQVLL
ncbi:hypothetical protein PR048_025857 [Dryococelus australis]|uniref:CST complex subunit CTC1 n=1 Tax=Dryococelus australis TaxID=614101 RepID=A0ABQ9GJQ6_9NEOP|nr:hypothetical protein PR048_025857 [Dryococelus australis]